MLTEEYVYYVESGMVKLPHLAAAWTWEMLIEPLCSAPGEFWTRGIIIKTFIEFSKNHTGSMTPVIFSIWVVRL